MKTAITSRLIVICLCALALAAVQPAPAAAQGLFSKDLTLHETTTGAGGMGGGANITTTTYFSGNAMKRSSSDGNDTIIRFDTGKMISIDNKKKTYTEMSMEELQAMLDKTAGAMQQMNGEAAAAMRKMMGGGGNLSFSVTKVGPGEPVAGYATEKYQVKGPIEMEIWAAPEVKVPAAYYDAMKARARPNPLFDMAKMYDEFKKINGMALKTVSTMKMMGKEMTTTTVVNSVEKGPVPASTFAIPAGYKQVAMK